MMEPKQYVLDGIDPDLASETIKALSLEGKKLQFDFTTTDWHTLRKLQPSSYKSAETSTAETVGHLPVLRYEQSWSTFEESSKREVVLRSSDEIAKAWENVESELADDGKKSAAEYFAAYLPDSDTMASENDGFIVRLFKALYRILKQLFTVVNRAGSAALKVLKDPDAVYLRLRGEVTEWLKTNGREGVGELLFLLPDLFRLYIRLLVDTRVSVKVKVKVLAAVAYLVLPYDLIPEAILGPLGYAEDAYFLARVILDLTNKNAIAEGLLREHWAGESGSLDKLMAITEWIDANVPLFSDLWSVFKRSTKPA